MRGCGRERRGGSSPSARRSGATPSPGRSTPDTSSARGGCGVHGVSMGAASAICALTEGYPEAVRGVVADCPFNSSLGVFAYYLRTRFHMPGFPILQIGYFAWALARRGGLRAHELRRRGRGGAGCPYCSCAPGRTPPCRPAAPRPSGRRGAAATSSWNSRTPTTPSAGRRTAKNTPAALEEFLAG